MQVPVSSNIFLAQSIWMIFLTWNAIASFRTVLVVYNYSPTSIIRTR